MPLKVIRRPGVKHLYIRGRVRGSRRIFETTGTDDAQAAEAIKIKRESELLDRSIFGAGATVTFAQAALSYLESGGEARFLGRQNVTTGKWSLLIGRFATMPVGQIGQLEADEAAIALCPRAGAATRKRHVYVPLCAVLRHAAKKGWRALPVIEHPKVKPPVTRWSTPERMGKLLPHCSPPLRRLVVLLAYTGARLSEALRIDWDRDVDLARRVIILRRTKNGKMRPVHIPDPLLIELSTVTVREQHGAMFHWSDKSHVHRPLRTACRRAGVDYLPPHQQGRHTYATWLRTFAGFDLMGIKEAGGWDSITSVARYAHVSPGEAAKAADRLPAVQIGRTEDEEPESAPIKKLQLRRKLNAARGAIRGLGKG